MILEYRNFRFFLTVNDMVAGCALLFMNNANNGQ